MALNVIAGFSKYKRFWMGSVMILVMLTFVLCTGSKGDFADKAMQWFQFGRTAAFRLDGTNYYRNDVEKINLQRKVANDYMATYSRILAEVIHERLRHQPAEFKSEDERKAFQKLAFTQHLLLLRKQSGKFFDSPNPDKKLSKTDEAVDFQVWLAEADRLGIRLQPKIVHQMVQIDLLRNEHDLPYDETLAIEQRAFQEVMRNASERVNVEFITAAIENEYRARIAQLADCEFQFRTQDPQIGRIKQLSLHKVFRPDQIRTPMSPGMLWDYFEANRKKFDALLMPVSATEFVGEIGEPDERKLQELFDAGKKTIYDPASSKPGFMKAHQVKVQYVSVDMKAPFYKKVVSAADIMTQYPIGSFVPQMPLATALTFAAGPTMFDSMLQRYYMNRLSAEQRARENFLIGPLLSDPGVGMVAYHARTKARPMAVAAMVGDAARPWSLESIAGATSGLLADAYFQKKDEIPAGVKPELKTLVPLFATVVASGAMPPGFASCGELNYLTRMPMFLPLAAVREDLVRDFDLGLASKLAMANIALFKKEIELVPRDPNQAPDQVERLLKRYGPDVPGVARDKSDKKYRDLGLEIAQTEKFYDRYTIKDAPELKPLLEAYYNYYTHINQIEGRDAQTKGDRVRGEPFKDDEFWRLFFDTEPLAAQKPYEAKPWPPVIKLGTPQQIENLLKNASDRRETLPVADYKAMKRQAETAEFNKDVTFNLFNTAERPFLFWKTEEETPKDPKSLDEARDRVVEAWKLQQARDAKALPFVKKFAEDLLNGKADRKMVMRQKDRGFVSFPNLAALYRDKDSPIYGEYKLERDKIRYPREDTVAQLLAMIDLKQPIKISAGDKSDAVAVALDNLNEELFKLAEKNGVEADRRIQILTNKPRDVFFLAFVDIAHGASKGEFYGEILPGASIDRKMMHNFFFERALESLGDEHYRALIRQLRANHRYRPGDDAKKDGEGDGGN